MSLFRTRWAALGAAVAITLGAGGISLVSATSPATALTFVAITPCRVLDTRPEFNIGPKSSPMDAGETHTVGTHGANGACTGIPTAAEAISLNVTALDATLPSFLTIWAADEPRPEASSLNPVPDTPPTPNAVTTEVDSSGRFNIYNLQGSVDVVADINGYYVDHHHDDRYYTKSQVETIVAEATAADDWSIHVAPTEFENPSITTFLPAIVRGTGPAVSLQGLGLDDNTLGTFWFGYALPLAYEAGAPLSVALQWLPEDAGAMNPPGCGYVMRANPVAVSRPGELQFNPAVTWGGYLGVAGQVRLERPNMPSGATTVQTTMLEIDGADLLPGDHIVMSLLRDGPNGNDKCGDLLYITGASVTQGT